MSIRAFQVQDEYGDGECRIVYAEKNVVARREGAAEMGLDFGGVSCRRAPWADEFAPNGPTPQQCIETGQWWYSCACGCGRHIDNEDGSGIHQDDSTENRMQPVYVDGCVFWNKACQDKREREIREHDAALAADQAQAEQQTLARYPFATEIKAYRGYAKGLDGKCSYDVLQASFLFPGGQFGVHWVLGSDEVRMHREDDAAWDALVAVEAQ